MKHILCNLFAYNTYYTKNTSDKLGLICNVTEVKGLIFLNNCICIERTRLLTWQKNVQMKYETFKNWIKRDEVSYDRNKLWNLIW